MRAYGSIEPGHVADQDERPRRCGALAPAPLDGLAAVAQRRAHRAAQVVAVRRARPRPRRVAAACAATARRARARQPRDQPARQLALGVRVLGEVLVAQQLDVAPGRRASGRARVGRPRSAVAPAAPGRRRAAAPARGRLRRAPAAGPRLAAGLAERTRRTRRRTPRGRRAASRARCAARSRRRARDDGSTAASARCAASSSPTPTRTPPARSDADQPAEAPHDRAPSAARLRHPRAPPRSRTRSMSSRTFSATPSVAVEVVGRRAPAAPAPRRSSPPRPGSL